MAETRSYEHPESRFPLWTSGLAVGAGLAWSVAIGLTIGDLSYNDQLPDTAVTLTAAIAIAATLCAACTGVANAQRHAVLNAIAEAKNDLQSDTAELPGLAEMVRGAELVITPRWPTARGSARAAEEPMVPAATVHEFTKEAYRIARRQRGADEA